MTSVIFQTQDSTTAQYAGASTPGTPSNRQKKKKSFGSWAIRDSQSRRDFVGRPGSKRFQRHMNKSFLLEQTEVSREDFYVFPKTRSIFGELMNDSEKLSQWENFIEVTEDQQEALLVSLSADVSDFLEKEHSQDEVTSELQFSKIDKKLRKLLKVHLESKILSDLDAQMYEYVNNGNFETLIYSFNEPFHRMICHGVCQFYALHSHSKDVAEERVVVVSKTKRTRFPKQTLSEHLKMMTL